MVLIKAVTNWVEGFPSSSEKATEVVKVLFKEIVVSTMPGPSEGQWALFYVSNNSRDGKGFKNKVPPPFYMKTSVFWKGEKGQLDSNTDSGKTLPRDL